MNNVKKNSAMRYFMAPDGWDYDQPNPFTPDGTYDGNWSAFEICDRQDDRRVYGRSSSGLFRDTNGLLVENLENHLADFLRYENKHGRSVIISLPPEMDVDSFVSQALQNTPAGSIVRHSDPQWVVHSATLETWELIRGAGCLKSFARLQSEGIPAHGIGFRELGEPDDFPEYVMLGPFDGIGCESVVASQAMGRVFTDENAPYTPGVRLYFDAHKIITAGLAVRDGLHTLKVHDNLPLQPYLIAAVTTEQVDPYNQVEKWTPRTFLEQSNAWFQRT